MFKVAAELTGFSRIDFDGRKIRKAIQTEGRAVQKAARRLVARRAVSGGGQYPGRATGTLQRAIKLRIFQSGFLAVLQPEKTAEMGADYYPAFLHYGVTGQARRSDHRAQAKSGKWRVEPRKNYMVDALVSRRERVRAALRSALQDALIPRK